MPHDFMKLLNELEARDNALRGMAAIRPIGRTAKRKSHSFVACSVLFPASTLEVILPTFSISISPQALPAVLRSHPSRRLLVDVQLRTMITGIFGIKSPQFIGNF
jgi:hypothetical protein